MAVPQGGDGFLGQLGFWIANSFLLVIIVVGLYDVYAIWWLPREATVSYQLRNWAEQLPLLGVLIGVVLGHLFFPLPR